MIRIEEGYGASPPAKGLRPRPVVIDAGHGGAVPLPTNAVYGSPAYGRANETAVEKDINLDVALRVCDKLGPGAVLSRSGDYSVSLRERIERARAANAAAFVSIHSNSGRTDHGGPEVWVFGDGVTPEGRPSSRLAQRIRDELVLEEHGPVAIRRGDLALLRPELHGDDVAACLVETGSLRHPSGRARLANHETLERIGEAVARGVSHYMERDFR